MELEINGEEDGVTGIASETGADGASGLDHHGRLLLYWTDRRTLLCADCVDDVGAAVERAFVRGAGSPGRCEGCGEDEGELRDDPPGFDADGEPLLHRTDRGTLLCVDCVVTVGAVVVASFVRPRGSGGRCDRCGEVDESGPAPSCATVTELLMARIRRAPRQTGEVEVRSVDLLDQMPDVSHGFVAEIADGVFWCTVERLV